MAKTLTERAFSQLAVELKAILTTAQAASSAEKSAGYWALGKRIAQAKLSQELGYHNTVLRELATTLDVSTRTLQQAVLFYTVYPELPKDGLSWAHYRLLSRLRAANERSFYAKHAVNDTWSVRELEVAIQSDLFGGGQIPSPVLSRPTTATYVYQIKNPLLVDGDTLDLDIDLGFQCWTRRRIRLAHVDTPEVGSKEGRAAKNFVQRQLAPALTLVIKSTKVDLHGRYIADLFFSPHQLSLDECYQSGKYLNALLVENGYATVVD